MMVYNFEELNAKLVAILSPYAVHWRHTSLLRCLQRMFRGYLGRSLSARKSVVYMIDVL